MQANLLVVAFSLTKSRHLIFIFYFKNSDFSKVTYQNYFSAKVNVLFFHL
jgi:hypothetical protein